MSARRYMEENGSVTMLIAMRSAGDTLELSLMQCGTYMPLPSANNTAHSGFEAQWRCHQNPKKGPHSGPTERTYVLQKLYKNWIHVSLLFANCYTFNNMTQAKLPVPVYTTLLKHSVTESLAPVLVVNCLKLLCCIFCLFFPENWICKESHVFESTWLSFTYYDKDYCTWASCCMCATYTSCKQVYTGSTNC